MTDPPGDDGTADGGFLTVDQVARLRQVTPAAVRAQLRTGTLAGEQVLQGQRTVWRIPVRAVRGAPEGAGAPSRPAPRGPVPDPAGQAAPGPSTGPAATTRPAAPPSPPPPPDPAPQPAGRGAAREPEPVTPGRVEALEAEVRRLRLRLAALAEAHRRLLDAVTADLTDDL